MRRYLNPSGADTVVSYAQNAEDVRLLRVFDGITDGFYVDIGAAHPSVGSVTRLFYDRGWSGVNIEPGPAFAELDRCRARDTNLPLVVGTRDEMVDFHVTSPDPGLSTTDLSAHQHDGTIVTATQSVRVRSRPLRDILAETAGGREIHFLKVDVEGAEADVLSSADFRLHRPIVILVEAIKTWSRTPSYMAWENVLLGAGYRFAAFDGVNRFYVREEDAHLASVLAYPISPLDRFSIYLPLVDQLHSQLVEAGRRASEAEAKLGAAERRAAATEAQFVALKRSLSWRLTRPFRFLARLVPAPFAAKARAMTYGAPWIVAIRTTRRYRRQLRFGRPWGIRPSPFGPAVQWKSLLRQYSPFTRRKTRSALRARALTDLRLQTISQSLAHPDRMRDPAWQAALADALDRADRQQDDCLHDRQYSRAQRSAMLEAEFAQVLAARHGDRRSQRAGDDQRRAIVVDARCLQDPNYRSRGIGLHARFVVEALRSGKSAEERIVLLVDPNLPDLDPELSRAVDRLIWAPSAIDRRQVSTLLCLSPMTAPIGPLVPFLLDDAICRITIVYDFIPAMQPAAYLRTSETRMVYRARLCALRCFDVFLPISRSVAEDLSAEIPGLDPSCVVATGVADALGGVEDAHNAATPPQLPAREYQIVPIGGDVRKNPLLVIAAEAIRRSADGNALAILVVGNLTNAQRDSIARFAGRAGLPSDDLFFAENVQPEHLSVMYRRATLCIVPSFAEGFSMPIAEALSRGTPVIASAIPVHRELLGDDWWLVPTDQPVALANAVRRALGQRESVLTAQKKTLGLQAESRAVAERLRNGIFGASRTRGEKRAARDGTLPEPGRRPQIAVATPWPPQKSGVAYYSRQTMGAMAGFADITILTNAPTAEPDPHVRLRRISAAAYLDPEFDCVVSVLGNSHLHLPALEYVSALGGPIIAHDNRMLEFYWTFWDLQSTADLLSTTGKPVRGDQVVAYLSNLNDLPNLGYREIARVADPLFVHSRGLAERVAAETGVAPIALPFVPQHQPRQGSVKAAEHRDARVRLGMDGAFLELGAFGFVDIRTKAAGALVEAASWLAQWGTPVRLHFVGGAMPEHRHALERQARSNGIADRLVFHEFADDATFQDFLLAVDVAVQLRSTPLLTLSGALLDCICFGVPTVTLDALKRELGAPEYVVTVPDKFSPLQVAERVLEIRSMRASQFDQIERQRRDYVESRPPLAYARRLLAGIRGSATWTEAGPHARAGV
ncbi:MAG: FkbM family methyltransferase [Alphaproteobacteria bacterium]|nr:FkbM family methyltransferase [Alphaproteobacteria bacterium]